MQVTPDVQGDTTLMAQNRARLDARGAAARRFSLFGFIGEVFSELRKVTWPSRQETMRLSLLVIAISAVMGAFLGLFDWGFSRLFSLLADT